MDTVVSSGIVKSVKQECHYMYYFTLSIFNLYSNVGHNELHFFQMKCGLNFHDMQIPRHTIARLHSANGVVLPSKFQNEKEMSQKLNY